MKKLLSVSLMLAMLIFLTACASSSMAPVPQTTQATAQSTEVPAQTTETPAQTTQAPAQTTEAPKPTEPPVTQPPETEPVQQAEIIIQEVRLQGDSYKTVSFEDKEDLKMGQPIVILKDGFICNADPEKNTQTVGATLSRMKLLKVDFDGNITEIGEYPQLLTAQSGPVSDGRFVYFGVTEALYKDSDSQYSTNVIYRIDLDALTLEEVYRSEEYLSEFRMALWQNSLIIRQVRKDGERRISWLEQVDLTEKKVVQKSEEYISANGFGRDLLNVSVDQDVIYGLLTERGEGDREQDPPQIILFNDRLEEVKRFSCDTVRYRYPEQFCVRNGVVYIGNWSNRETFAATIEGDALKEVFRKQNMGLRIPWTAGNDPILISTEFSEDKGVLFSWDAASGTMRASKVFFEEDKSTPGSVSWQADGRLLFGMVNDEMKNKKFAAVDYSRIFPE